MPRPKEYEDGSVETGVRLQGDVHARLVEEAQARQVGRSKLVNEALRRFFGMKKASPTIPVGNAPRSIPPTTKAKTRVAPRSPLRRT